MKPLTDDQQLSRNGRRSTIGNNSGARHSNVVIRGVGIASVWGMPEEQAGREL